MRSIRFDAAGMAALAILGAITSAALYGSTKASAQPSGLAPPTNACDRLVGAYLAGCHPPSNDPCDPTYAGYHANQFTAQLARQACAEQRQRQQQRQAEKQQHQADQQREQEAAERQNFEQQRARARAATRGYELIPSVKDLILDGKTLASRNAKIQLTGVYKRLGASERLYGNLIDAYQENDNYIPVLTDDAQRDLREYLLTQACRPQFRGLGCQIEVGGHMTKCRFLAAELVNYPEVPCLNIEVQIIYRPGD